MAEDNRQKDDSGISKVIMQMRKDRMNDNAKRTKSDGDLQQTADHTLKEQERTSKLLETMLDGMNLDRQRAQDKDEKGKPEKKKDKPPKPDVEGGFAFGIGTILSGIAGAVSGLAIGIVLGFTKALKFIGEALGLKKLFAPVNKAVFGFVDRIKRIPKFFQNFSRLLKAGFDGSKTIRSAFTGTFMTTQKGLTGLNQFFFNLGASLKKLAFSKTGLAIQRSINKFKRFIKPLGDFFASIGRAFGGVPKTFKSIGDGASKFGKITKALGGTFGKMFLLFKSIGRYIAFPITIIMSIVDAVKGFFSGFKEFGERGFIAGLFGGVMGAIKGVFNGLISLPLDLLKGAVGWIAGKLGFENVENALAGFSFKGFFSSIFDWLTNFILDLPGMIIDGMINGIKAIGDFFSGIDFGGFFGGIGDKVGEWWGKASDGFFKKFQHAKDTFSKFKGKVAGMQDKFRMFIMDKLPEKGSFLEKFVPDAVYEWAGQTGRFAPPPKKDDAVDAPAKEVEEEVEITDAQRKMAEKLGLKVPEQASTESTEQEPVPVEVKLNQELNDARMESIKTGDNQPLMEKKLEVASLEDRVPDRPFTQEELDAETDQSTKDWMLWFNSPEGIEHQKKMQIERDEREKQFQIQMAEAKMKREEEHAKMMERAMILRAERAEKAREMLATGMYKGQQITDEQRRRAELYIEREEQTRAQAQAMVVAPQTNVTNNTSPTAVVADMNMPVVDNLDRTYGT